MRGDARSNRDCHTDGHSQQDSSSGSSSPHSNASRSDEILEVNPPGYMAKPIYNFSIPDVIKHEPRVERHENNERLDCSIPNNSVRKRTLANHHLHDQNNQDNDTPVSVTNRKKRRRVGGAENLIDDDDGDCHLPPVIDLTDIDSHDEYTNAHSDSEINNSSHIETRPHHHTTSSPSFNAVLSNLERFRQQMVESHERVHLLRSNNLHRLRRRRNMSRTIITDGPLVTDDMLIQSPETVNVSTPEIASGDDSVMVINEVRGDSSVYIDDHDIALRMANDPTFSPPYHPAPNASNEHSGSPLRYSDESFNQFQERIRCIRQRNRDRFNQVRRMSYEAQVRLARIHDSINSLRHGRRPPENTTDPTEIQDDNDENLERYLQNNDNDETSNDDVEIIRESNARDTTLDYLEPPINGLAHAPFVFRSSNENSHNQRPLPDFVSIMNSFWGPLRPPRLHHLHEVPEGYEVLWNLAERLGPAKPRGLNKQEIDQIPSFRFSATTAKETNTKCVVCMGEYNNREKLRRLPCTHDFHSKCIDKWLRSNKTCPVCRDEVKIEGNKTFSP